MATIYELLFSGRYITLGVIFCFDTYYKVILSYKIDYMERTRNFVNNKPLVDEDSDDLDYKKFKEHEESGDFNEKDIASTKTGFIVKKFKNDFCRQVYYLAKFGARDVDIADFFNVHIDTVIRWKEENLDFKESWKEGKFIIGMKIVDTLVQRALGYDYQETQVDQRLNRHGDIVTTKSLINKHMPPDVGAICFYLKNRFKEDWNDRIDVNNTYNVNDESKKVDITLYNDEERKILKGILVKSIAQQNGVSSK